MFETETLTLKSGTKLNYASENSVKISIENKGFSSLKGTDQLKYSDLTAGIYEGGLKIWEGALDLCNFIDTLNENEFEGRKVLELGCGAALPTILSLKKGANSAVILDFNEFVIECFTKRNFLLNEIPDTKWKAFHGDWANVDFGMDLKSFDLILTSETIYNESNYESLHTTFDKYLSNNGKIFLAAKVYYFGLGASLATFEEFVKSKKVFAIEDLWISTDSSVPRKIIQLERINRN